MWFKRMLWLLGALILALCHVVTGRALFAALTFAILVLPFGSLALLLIASRRVSAAIALPDHAAKGETIEAEIRLKGSPLLSAMHAQIICRAANLLTGEIRPMRLACTSGGAQINIESPRCGKLSVEIEGIWIKDSFGLFRRKRALDVRAAVLILPDTFEPALELQSPDAPDMNSDEYSAVRPGDDPGALFGIRDYREGDPLHSIHWKLSSKFNRMIVKEQSLPVANAVLLLLDNCPTAPFTADAASLACEALISVSQALADLYVPHQIAWFDRENGLMQALSITSLDDLAGEQGRLLSARMLQDAQGIAARAIDSEAIAAARRILLFAPVQPAHAEAFEGETTLLLPEADPPQAISCLPDHLTRLLI